MIRNEVRKVVHYNLLSLHGSRLTRMWRPPMAFTDLKVNSRGGPLTASIMSTVKTASNLLPSKMKTQSFPKKVHRSLVHIKFWCEKNPSFSSIFVEFQSSFQHGECQKHQDSQISRGFSLHLPLRRACPQKNQEYDPNTWDFFLFLN